MALRTTETEVKGLLLDDYGVRPDGTEPSLTRFLRTANVLVNRVITCATRKGSTLSDEEAELLEMWLSAHFYVMSDQNYSSKSTSGASASFQGQTGKRLEASKYGQTALDIDPSGCLENITMGQQASMGWVGKPPSEQVDYDDRD